MEMSAAVPCVYPLSLFSLNLTRLCALSSPGFFYECCSIIPIGASSTALSFIVHSHTRSVIIGYELLLCFGQEVKCIWQRKPSLIHVLYIILRYFALINVSVSASTPTTLIVRFQSLLFVLDLLTFACRRTSFANLLLGCGIHPSVHLRCRALIIMYYILTTCTLFATASTSSFPRHHING